MFKLVVLALVLKLDTGLGLLRNGFFAEIWKVETLENFKNCSFLNDFLNALYLGSQPEIFLNTEIVLVKRPEKFKEELAGS